MRLFSVAVLMVVVTANVVAEDLSTVSGKLFKNFEVTGVGAESVNVKHEGGMTAVPIFDLPPDVRRRFSAEQLFLRLQERNREIERLQAELARVTGQLQQRNSPVVPAAVARPNREPATQQRLTPPLQNLPALRSGEIVEVDDLINHYKQDRLVADQRYKNKTFVVQGRVEQFAPRLFLRSYTVHLESPDRYFRVACQFAYPDEFKSVVAKDNESRLSASLANGGERTLLRLGDAAKIRGTCGGVENNAVVFKGCETVP